MTAQMQAATREQHGDDMTISPGQLLVPIPDTCSTLGGVSRTTVYALVNQNELVKVNIGRRGFITSESLAAYVERLAAASSDEDGPDRQTRTTPPPPPQKRAPPV
jgi:hypothetical protein